MYFALYSLPFRFFCSTFQWLNLIIYTDAILFAKYCDAYQEYPAALQEL